MEIRISEVLVGFAKRWRLFPMFVGALWIIGGVYLVVAQPQYRAQANLFYVDQSRPSQNAGATVASALASTVGIAASSDSERQIALAVLNSNSLMAKFIEANNLLPVLFADRWDDKRNRWAVSGDKIPTLDMAVSRMRSLRTVSDNSDTGIITVTLTLPRRDLVASLLNRFVAAADGSLRERSLKRAESSYGYLEDQLANMTMTDLRASMIALAAQQLQQMMMAKNVGAFALEVIDPATPPREPVWPRPLLLFGLLTVLGLIAAAGISVVLDVRGAV